MHSVNLDLLRAASIRHPDAHAHHRAAHLDALRQQRKLARAAWLHRISARLARLVPVGLKPRRSTTPGILCPKVSHGGPAV